MSDTDRENTESRILQSENERCSCDFDSLSSAEIEVFAIEPALRDALAEAYWRYEALIGSINDDDNGRRDEDRARFPQYLKSTSEGAPVINYDDAAQFMSRAAELPIEQCCRWILKVRALEHRRGLICHRDP
ncbi:MAG: hypothetical protein DCF16_15080 [Alphaproteobacteria bacterium]|nr:MAG: hypothetical protein DCF16_15080 [Alphaproteobacteria bacterium]